MDVFRTLVGSRIRVLREKIGMNQAQLAEACGLEINTISRYETGTHAPSMEHLLSLAAVFKVSPIAILSTEYPGNSHDFEKLELESNTFPSPKQTELTTAQMELFKLVLGDKIRILRKGLEKSQDDIARETGVDKSTISRYEKGKSAPSIEHLLTLAEALGVSPMELLPNKNSTFQDLDLIRNKITERINKIRSAESLQEILLFSTNLS